MDVVLVLLGGGGFSNVQYFMMEFVCFLVLPLSVDIAVDRREVLFHFHFHDSKWLG